MEEIVFQQKRRGTKTWFRFNDDRLEYSVQDPSGAKVGFSTGYGNIGSEKTYETLVLKETTIPIYRMFSIYLVILAGCIVISPKVGKETIGMVTLFVTVFFFTFIAASITMQTLRARDVIFKKKEFTKIPLQNNRILVLRDQQHDKIIGEIQNRRKSALRKLAVIDSLNHPQQELKKFIWLKDEKIISDEEYETYKERLLSMTPTNWEPISEAKNPLN